MEAETLLKSGDIAGARASLAALLRREPGNPQARQFFWQLIALHGEWEKAGSQLQALATAAEAPGGGWYWPSAAAHPSLPRGALLEVGVGQRPSLDQVLNGPSDDPFGSLNLVGGLRRSMAKAGYCDLKEFQKVGLTVGS